MKKTLFILTYLILFSLAGFGIAKLYIVAPSVAYVFGALWTALVIYTARGLKGDKFTLPVLLLVALSSSGGCDNFDETLGYRVPEELDSIVDAFVAQGRIYNHDVSFVYDELTVFYVKDYVQQGYFGMCSHEGHEIVIRLDEDYVQYNLKWHPGRVYILLFHELGHGALHRHHCDWYSIMNPDLPQSEEDWQGLSMELFTNA